MEKFIHIRNWDRYQHADTGRTEHAAIPWIKSYTGQLHDGDFLELSWADRGLLESLRLQYALNRGRGIVQATSKLNRMLGQRVTSPQLKRLNDAGFITLTASRTQAERLHDACLEKDTDKEVEKTPATESPEEPVDNSRPASFHSLLNSEDIAVMAEDSTPSTNGNGHARVWDDNGVRDLLWDELETLFGSVTSGTNAHAKRNKAVKDLKRLEASVELVPRAVARWRQLHPNAELTDMALATHYPQLTVGMRAQVPACSECGMGGGLHVSDCSLIPGLLEEDAA